MSVPAAGAPSGPIPAPHLKEVAGETTRLELTILGKKPEIKAGKRSYEVMNGNSQATEVTKKAMASMNTQLPPTRH